MAEAQFRHQEFAKVPRGWQVRTVKRGAHEARIAFPPGPRKKGAGRLVEVLHPKSEHNPDPECLFIVDDAVKQTGAPELGTPESKALVSGVRHIVTVPIPLNGNPKSKTREAVEKMQAKAVRFLRDVVGDDEKAEEIGDLSLEEYADRKRVHLVNPHHGRKAKPKKKNALPLVDAWSQASPAMRRRLMQSAGTPGPYAEIASFYRLPVRVQQAIARAMAQAKRPVQTSARRNYSETIHDEKGRKYDVDVQWRSEDQLWEAIAKGKGKRLVARGRNESEAYDNLLEKIMPNPRRGKARPNFDEILEAQTLYETFQGREADAILEFNEPDKARDDFAILGHLLEHVYQPRTAEDDGPADAAKVAKIVDEFYDEERRKMTAGWDAIWSEVGKRLGVPLVWINFRGDKVYLASNAEGTQLYNLSGKQDLTSVLDEFETDRSKDLVDLGYLIAVQYAARKGHDGNQLTDYYHILAEEGGRPPIGVYDQLKKRIFFAGGDYRIERPGIIN